MKRWFFSRRITTSDGLKVKGGINNSASFIEDALSSGIVGISEEVPSVTVNLPKESKLITALFPR